MASNDAYRSVLTVCRTSRSSGETQAMTTVLVGLRTAISKQSRKSSVKGERRYGMCRCFELPDASALARMQSFNVMSEVLINFVSLLRYLSCVALSAVFSLPAKSTMKSSPGLAQFACLETMLTRAIMCVREDVSLRPVAFVVRRLAASSKAANNISEFWHSSGCVPNIFNYPLTSSTICTYAPVSKSMLRRDCISSTVKVMV